MRRSCALVALAAGCAAQPVPDGDTSPSSTSASPALTTAAAPAEAPTTAPVEAATAATTATETVAAPADIVGYLRGNRIPRQRQGSGKVASIEKKPNRSVPEVSDLRFALAETTGKRHEFEVVVPPRLPTPFAVGDALSFRAQFAGGGPNTRGTFVLLAADGSLVFAVDLKPDGWTIDKGSRVKTSNGGDDKTHRHEVIFTHGGLRSVVPPDSWARIDTPEGAFLLWGTAVERERLTSGPPPPDYVGGWLDFGIVRIP
jgi:hypothetical protein